MKKVSRGIAVALAVLLSTYARGAVRTWKGPGTMLSDPANWVGGVATT